MREMKYAISMPVIIFTLGLFTIVSYAQENSIGSQNPLLISELSYNRKLNDWGPGKKLYLTEYKRLPVFDFGLGKRSQPYNFGLGKRSDVNEDADDMEEYDEYNFFEDDNPIPELELYQDDTMQSLDKRQKAYNFGLGKRQNRYDFGLGKRGGKAYNFGLGKRAGISLNRDRFKNYLMRGGTRLGKRPNQSRFNFGLGKRSEEFDLSKNIIAKREVHQSEEENVSNENAATGNHKLLNRTSSELDSHEGMRHFDKSTLSKRSLNKYLQEVKPIGHNTNLGFSRQFRKPLYNFGLGKRTSSNHDMNNSKNKVSNK